MAHAVYAEHGTLREYLQRIEDALASEQVDDALNTCRYVQAQFPEALEVQRLLGEIHLKQGVLQEAQQAFDWVLTNDPENVVVYCDRALMSELMNDYETALDCYQQAYELSRGNSDIRQQFNILSAKSGQQGFMLSRAGLARLYMRGDLLAQAAQEWEIVLALTPERLDARTGLLETYWRQGLDERVEQLAHQILGDIPECLKALLLLAHVSAPRDMHQAREFMKRAEQLDPDLLMARDLFSDAIAAQPGHPFWKLVNKSPAVVEQSEPSMQAMPRSASSAMRDQMLIPNTLTHSSTSDALVDWSGLDGWQGIDALMNSTEQVSPLQEYSPRQEWPEDMQELRAQKSVEDLPTIEVPLPRNEQSVLQDGPSPDALHTDWMQLLQEQDAIIPQQENVWASSSLAGNEALDTPASPPAWLSMLARDDQPVQQIQQEPQFDAGSVNGTSVTNQNRLADVGPGVPSRLGDVNDALWNQEPQNILKQTQAMHETDSDGEESFFGPEWLKSLGAASMDAEISPVQHEQEAQDVLTTLEVLEQDLRQQGFVPLEPNTLSTIAQSQPDMTPIHEESLQEDVVGQEPGVSTSEWYERQNALLSSVLAQLGHSVEPSSQEPHQSQPSSQETVSEPSHEAYLQQEPSFDTRSTETGTPSWADTFLTVPAAASVPYILSESVTSVSEEPFATPSSSANQQEEPAVELPTTLSYPMHIEQQPQATQQTLRSEDAQSMKEQVPPVVPEPAFAPQLPPLPVPTPQSEHQKLVASLNNVFSDDLEVTMKRPAVRLQSMQKTRPVANTSSSPAHNERAVQAGHGELMQKREVRPASRSDVGSNYQERLRRGYQHQQVGDYDEAMQEYRIIIRSAPELLNDVVGNVRSLLTLAPKYSAGYRVLGDAYMRQGEYLQAMDAYNQALAITKKARA